jgi:hypothetical protein
VGPVGLWMPWEPDAYKTGRVEYLESELNQLMHQKRANEESAKDHFDKRVKETKQQAIEENIKKATKTGNKLTQSINANGDLVNLTTNSIVGTPGIGNLEHELFETDDVVMDKNSDHGLSRLSQNKI